MVLDLVVEAAEQPCDERWVRVESRCRQRMPAGDSVSRTQSRSGAYASATRSDTIGPPVRESRVVCRRIAGISEALL